MAAKSYDRDYRKLERLVKVIRRNFLSDTSSKFHEVRDRRISKQTIQYHLNKHAFNRRVSRKRVVIREVNRKNKTKKKKKTTVKVFRKAYMACI